MGIMTWREAEVLTRENTQLNTGIDPNPFLTLTLTPEGHLEGERLGGYAYAWVIAKT